MSPQMRPAAAWAGLGICAILLGNLTECSTPDCSETATCGRADPLPKDGAAPDSDAPTGADADDSAPDRSDASETSGDELGADADASPLDADAHEAEVTLPPCSATCVAALPDTWSGPVLLYTGAYSLSAPPPSCPSGFAALDAHDAPTGATSDGCSCACVPSRQVCSAAVNFFTSMNCVGNCATVPVTTGQCGPLPASSQCGLRGSAFVGSITPSGGTCTGMTTVARGTDPMFTVRARLCSPVGASPTQGTCGAGGTCLPSPPGSFGSAYCIYNADPSATSLQTCPAPFNAKPPGVFYLDVLDTRACTPCTCGSAPSGGSCTGTVTLSAPASNCGSPAVSAMPGCNMNIGPGDTRGDFTLTTPGTCSTAVNTTPTGSVTGAKPVTVCCLGGH